jgi:hypothetical protein
MDTLNANTGINDSSSPWGNLVSNLGGAALQIGANVANNYAHQITGAQQTASQTAQPASTAQKVVNNGSQTAQVTSWKSYIPWIIGGVVVLVLGLVFIRRK